MSKPNIFILDVDGVMTTGQFLYTKSGKTEKVFGPDDADALNILKNYMKIIFCLLIRGVLKFQKNE